jgi:hypothetical protein
VRLATLALAKVVVHRTPEYIESELVKVDDRAGRVCAMNAWLGTNNAAASATSPAARLLNSHLTAIIGWESLVAPIKNSHSYTFRIHLITKVQTSGKVEKRTDGEACDRQGE